MSGENISAESWCKRNLSARPRRDGRAAREPGGRRSRRVVPGRIAGRSDQNPGASARADRGAARAGADAPRQKRPGVARDGDIEVASSVKSCPLWLSTSLLLCSPRGLLLAWLISSGDSPRTLDTGAVEILPSLPEGSSIPHAWAGPSSSITSVATPGGAWRRGSRG